MEIFEILFDKDIFFIGWIKLLLLKIGRFNCFKVDCLGEFNFDNSFRICFFLFIGYSLYVLLEYLIGKK